MLRQRPPLLAAAAVSSALAALLTACVTAPPAQPTTAAATPSTAAARGPGVCAILSINDTYRIEPSPDGTGGMARVRTLRTRLQAQYPDLLVFHAGDFLFPSLLSRQYRGAQMIDVLNRLDGSDNSFDPRLFVTFGNHELDDERASVFAARLAQSEFRWVSSNTDFAKGKDGIPLVSTHKVAEDVVLPCGGFDVGIFGLTTDEKKVPFLYSFRDPLETARARSAALRARGAAVVIGLTHLDIALDTHILETLGADGPDLIVGGHEHVRQVRTISAKGEKAEAIRGVFKADTDARTANLIRVTLDGTGPHVAHEWIPLGPTDPPEDPALAGVIAEWIRDHDTLYCPGRLKLPPGCLAERLTVANADFIAEELEMRRFETNVGDLVVDRALEAYRDQGAQIAFINSGSLRLNSNIPKGSDITCRRAEELFPYPLPLRLIEIDGATLQEVVSRAVRGWTGQGYFLQIAGFAFRHDPATSTARGLTLLGPAPRAIRPTEKLRAVVGSYLLDASKGQDGYTMISPANLVDTLGSDLTLGPDLSALFHTFLRLQGAAGLTPAPMGRICNTQRQGPCLALDIP